MERETLTSLTTQEMASIEGGAALYTCALLGGLTAAAFLAGQWWAVAGSVIGAYNVGCFRTTE
jgi:hypothetical protein